MPNHANRQRIRMVISLAVLAQPRSPFHFVKKKLVMLDSIDVDELCRQQNKEVTHKFAVVIVREPINIVLLGHQDLCSAM